MLIDKIRGKDLDEFFQGILTLKTVEECYSFFDDLCTVNEIGTFLKNLKWPKCCLTTTHIVRLKMKQVQAQPQSPVRSGLCITEMIVMKLCSAA